MMSSQIDNRSLFTRLFRAIVDKIAERKVMWKVGGVLTAGCIAFNFLAYAPDAFEPLRLYEFWPLLIVPGAIYFIAAGHRQHKTDGMPIFFPFFAIATALLFLLLIAMMLTEWAVDWSVSVSLLSLLILLVAAWITAMGLIAYTEIWRVWGRLNSAVINNVWMALNDGSFDEGTKTSLDKNEWGSPHCLRIARGYYDEKSLSALKHIYNDVERGDLSGYQNAGDALYNYLDLQWPSEVLHIDMKMWKRDEIAREVMTCSLFLRPSTNKKLHEMLNMYATDKPIVGGEQYRELVLLILDSAFSGNRIKDIDTARGIIEKAIYLYSKLLSQPSSYNNLALGKLHINQREISSGIWLALAPRFLDRQASFDVWMMMREKHNDLFVPPDLLYERDLVKAAARVSIIRLYEDWQQRMPAGWVNSMAGRTAYAKELARKEEGRFL
jgi:hypothetical protein